MSQRILMVAGEASADLHGAMVVRQLKERHPDIEVFGIGGPQMVAAGFVPTAQASEISVMGMTEVLFAIPRIWGIARRLVAEARRDPPAAAVLLDLPDFNLRLAKRLKALGIPIIYYISPQVWAWRERRVKQIKQLVDRMLVILPFEEDFYKERGVQAHFVGHPLVEELPPGADDGAAARNRLAIPAEAKVVALLPGSRRAELARHLPVILATAASIVEQRPEVRFLLPVASAELRPRVEQALAGRELPITVLDGDASTALAAADVAAVCSGTATLQTALLGVPMVVFYRVSWITYWIFRTLVRVGSIALVNLIAGRQLITELIQSDFTVARLTDELSALLGDDQRRQALRADLTALRERLGSRVASAEVATVVECYLQVDACADPE